VSETRIVKLDGDLCSRAEQKFGAEFSNLELFLEFLLREILRDDGAKAEEAEQRFVEERLRDLGYL